MLEDRVQYALNKLIIPNYFVETKSGYELIEEDKNGRSLLKLQVGTEDNLCVQNYDSQKIKKCTFLREDKDLYMQKCIDHFILRKKQNEWELHMVEMKTTIGFWTWFNIKYKMRASYLNIKALAVFLGISLKDENIFAYTTYEKESFDVSKMDSPIVALPRIGGRAVNSKKEEWDADCINIPIMVSANNPYDFKTFIKLQHTKILMNRSSDGKRLEQEWSLKG